MHESNSLIEFSNTMLASVTKHFNYILSDLEIQCTNQ